jgi:hypothetical protein
MVHIVVHSRDLEVPLVLLDLGVVEQAGGHAGLLCQGRVNYLVPRTLRLASKHTILYI